MKHNRVRLSKLSLGLIAALAAAPAFAQNTSAGVGGTVTGADGQPVAGAEVTITHVESGTVSRATTDANGRYTARGLRVGGPYSITVNKAGSGTDTEENVYLGLSQISTVDAQLKNDVTTLGTVQAVAAGGSEIFSATKMGTGTNVTRETIEALPSIGGNIQDYMRTDPRVAFIDRASGSISAGGQNPRYNAIRIDGVSASDTFGLEGNNMPTRRQPVAMEAIEAINIDLANYDVTITGATGAVVDAVTKSGTNDFHGSVYGTYRDDSMVGDDPPDASGRRNEFAGFKKEENYGFTLGGPLIKDKLFFFVNYDKFKQAAPGADVTSGPLGEGTLTDADITRAQQIAQGFGIAAGSLASNSDTDVEEYAVKLDWNINDDHRASFRYSKIDQSKLRLNGFFAGDDGAVSLSSYWYQHDKKVESYVAQLFSDWSDKLSTEFKVSYRDYTAVRNIPTNAPSVEILFAEDGDYSNPDVAPSGASIFLGTETNSQANVLETKTWNAFGAATWHAGDHDVKFGFDYSNNEIYNLFGPQVYGVYQFYGMDRFAAGEWSRYDLRTPRAGQDVDSIAAVFKYKNYGLFVQDQWFVNDRLTLTFGLRGDKSDVNVNPEHNALAQQVFGYDNSKVLSGDILWQPRFGFNYTFNSERPTQLRGGVGLFQGDSPQVWLSNAYSTTGLNYIQYTQFHNSGENWEDLPFNGNGNNQPVPGNPASQRQNVNFVSPDFEQPSTWKANLAIDHELPWNNIVFSAELLLTKVKNALFYRNLNLGTATGIAQDGRLLYWDPNKPSDWASGNARSQRDKRFDQVMLLDTTHKGSSQQFTVGLEKPWTPGSDWSWSLAYTHTNAEEVSGLTSSTATSGWNYNYVFQDNADEATTARYEIEHRITGALSWKHNFFGDYKTEIGLFYEGRSGRPYSYLFSNDVNGDGRNNDLFYVPNGPGDVLFGTYRNGVFTADPAKEKAFFEWLGKHPELARYRGGYAPANSGRASWVNTFDVRISQELPGFFKDNKAEIWLDIQNVGNLINKDWGHIYDYGFFADKTVLNAPSIVGGKYVYNFTGAEASTPANADADGFNVGVSQWSVQVGFRYQF
ncbi:TonB-dependent receptor [Luteimonas aquatica]|uniref:TonB-dependent receptor n=1 Tax=Luteimonas aquatica TaxID=450364 RepID=UPI001F5A34A2|nr:TonB-dependent receptor [Luteimonas aquatica]